MVCPKRRRRTWQLAGCYALFCALVCSLLVTSATRALHTPPGTSTADRQPLIQLQGQPAATPLFSDANIAPGALIARCAEVLARADDGPFDVRLYGDISGQLAEHLHLTVDEGRLAPGERDGSCDRFSPIRTVFDDRLASFPSHPARGVGSWTPDRYGQRRAYRLQLQLPEGQAAEAASATVELDFRWTARRR